jgi:hypothetical protein
MATLLQAGCLATTIAVREGGLAVIPAVLDRK